MICCAQLRLFSLSFSLISLLVLALFHAAEASAADIAPNVERFLAKNCVHCHGPDKQKGMLRFDTLSGTISDAAVAQRWQDILDVLNLAEMPPPDEKQPPKAELADALEMLTANLIDARRRLVDSGGDIVVRRLNRREYQQTIRDLFGVPVEIEFLPEDEKIDGFDTIGHAQGFSSLHLERYLDLGKRVLNLVVTTNKKKSSAPLKKTVNFGNTTTSFIEQIKKLESTITKLEEPGGGKKKGDALKLQIAQTERKLIDEYRTYPAAQTGAVIPFRGLKPSVDFTFANNTALGIYRVRVHCGAASDKPDNNLFLKVVRGDFRSKVPDAVNYYQVTSTMAAPQIVEFTIEIDGGILANRLSFERRNERGKTAPALADAPNYYFTFPEIGKLIENQQTNLWINAIDVEGPLPSAELPLSAKQLFAGRDPNKLSDAEVRPLVEQFAFQTFRHQAPTSDYVDHLMKVFAAGRAHGATLPDALKDTLAIILASPSFLYLHEPRPENQPPRLLSDRELAIRLSYFLWSAPPDQELWQVVDSGKLRDPKIISAQISRLVASERSTLFVETFLSGWLELERLKTINPESTHSISYDDATQHSTHRETIAYFQTLLRENLPVHALIQSDFVTVDSIAARFYGLSDVNGDEFRKVKLPADSVRGGLLGQSAILTLTGTGDRTSPVERGAFVLRKLLDRAPPPAPANVPMLDEKQIGTRSIRETLDQHMTKAQCQSCHRRIDPLGFGLEKFDQVGLLRNQVLSADGKKYFPITTAGTMPDGKRAFTDYSQMRQFIMEDRDSLLRVLTRNLMTYALGRTVGFTDQDYINQIVATTAKEGYGLGTLLHHIVQSKPFLTK